MESDFWHERWQRGELGWHLDEFNPLLLRYWPRLGVEPATQVFVPLCGKTRDLAWLVERGHPVLGVELSRLGVEAYFAEANQTPTVIDEGPFRRYRSGRLDVLCGDFFDLEPWHVRGVGAVYDRGSLVALEPGLRQRYAAHFGTLFDVPVRSLVISFDYPQQEMDGPPFSVGTEQVERLFGATHRIESMARQDALAENPRFRERGLTRMDELVFALHPLITRS